MSPVFRKSRYMHAPSLGMHDTYNVATPIDTKCISRHRRRRFGLHRTSKGMDYWLSQLFATWGNTGAQTEYFIRFQTDSSKPRAPRPCTIEKNRQRTQRLWRRRRGKLERSKVCGKTCLFIEGSSRLVVPQETIPAVQSQNCDMLPRPTVVAMQQDSRITSRAKGSNIEVPLMQCRELGTER